MKCDHDCFNCKYPDCIDNSLPRENESATEYLPLTSKQKWYEKNKEHVRRYNAEYHKKRRKKDGI